MKYLFVLEPAIEMGNPEFRFATLRSSLVHQIKALRSFGVETHLITGEVVANKAMQEGFLEDLNSVSIIDHFEWTQGENSLERSLRHQEKNYKDGEIERIKNLVLAKLPDGFFPDAVFVWESPMYFLEEIFQGVKVVYQMPGFFSRSPFPELINFDVGLLDRSSGSNFIANKINNIDVDLEVLRIKDKNFFQSLNKVEPIVRNFKHRFQGLVLLPLQIDNYFMVDHLLQRKSQFDIVLEFLKNTPSNIGVVVTNYWSGRLKSSVLSEENIRYLRNKFNNFIYFEKFNSIQSVSQLLLPLMNGVYTISSSVGSQAAYWGKPLLSVGVSHISQYNTANNLDKFFEQVVSNVEIHQDTLIRQDILQRNYPVEWVKNKPEQFVKWVVDFVGSVQPVQWTTDKEFLQNVSSLRREQAYLKHSGFAKTISDAHSLTHCANLAEQIKKHEIVSFDIFDTLLFRPFKHPSDMFEFMSNEVALLINRKDINFKDIRRQSEKLAFEAAIARQEGETHIDEIYEHFQALVQCTQEEAANVKALEMQMEYELLYERKSGKTAFNQAISLGKRVIVISDMYLPQDFLEKILHKNGYSGYEKIFVSSEVKQKKHSGRLFDHVLVEMNVPAQSILHVGDNLQADVIKAKERGIKPFHLTKASEVFEQSDAYKAIWTRDEDRHSLDAQMMIAMVGNTLQDNPYLPNRRGTLFSGDAWRLGYYGFGIFLFGYVKWIMEQSIRDKKDRLYFLSRDGLIMKKAYDLLARNYPDAPESHYLLCSRRAVNLAKIKDESGIIDLLNVDYAQTSIGHLFNARFGLKENDIDLDVLKQNKFALDSRINAKHRAVLKEILLAHKDKIFAIAKRERENYLQYLQQEKLFQAGNIAIVDIGYAGTMQESLYELMGNQKALDGYYLMTFRQALQRVEKNGLFAKAYLANFIDRHDTYHPFCKFVPLYETLFSNTETTFLKMEKDWNGELRAVHMDRFPQEQIRENVVARVHDGALQFIENCTLVFGYRINKLDIEPNKSMRVLDRYFSDPHPVDAEIMSGVVFEDSYGGAGLKIILSENSSANSIVWVAGKKSLDAVRENLPRVKVKNQDPIVVKKHLEKIFIGAVVERFSSDKKNKKFKSNPAMFFDDSTSLFGRVAKKVYFFRGGV